MLLVKLNGVDITDKVDYNSLKITEQMNNRSNTCSFSVSNYMVPEGAIVEVWDGSEITVDAISGTPTISVDDTFEYHQKYRVGDELRIPAGSSGAIKRIIQSINHVADTITFTENLGTAYIKGTKVGRLLFAGVTLKNPDQEIGCSGVFVFNVMASDFTKLFDAKNVVDTFESQYPREVIGRVVHKFTAPSSFLEITDAETTDRFKASGVARTLATSTDCAYKAKSISTGATGAGTVSVRTMAGANIGAYDGYFDEGGLNARVGIENRTFEAPVISGHLYYTSMTAGQAEEFGWRAGGNTIGSGNGPALLANGSAFGQPNGTVSPQAIALQDDSWIETDIYINEAGSYTLWWEEAYRSMGGANSYTWTIDGSVNYGPYTALSTSWTQRNIAITLTKGWHTLRVKGTQAGDKTTFMDWIQLTKATSNYNWKGNDNFCSIAKRGVNGGPCLKISLRAGDYREVQTHQAGYFIGSAGYTVKPNTKYKIAGWIKVVGTGTMVSGAIMGLLGNKTSGTWEYWTPAVLAANGGWQYYEREFTTPVDATYAHSSCNFYNHNSSTFTGSVYFDEFTITEVVDASTKTHLRTWTKIGLSQLAKLSAPKVRAKTTENDYFEWTNPIQVEDCWSYDSFEFASATQVGTPLQNSISSVELLWTASTTIPQDGILIDQISLTSGGFTIRNVMRGTTKYGDIRAQYKKPTVLLEELAKLQKLYWYVDYERDIHFFEQETYTCPMEITDTSEVYGDLSITADISQLKNRQVVRGGEAVDSGTYTQDEVTDGKMESWRLDYKPKGLRIYVDTTGTGTSYSEKSVGVENLDSAADFDYLYNFNEKIVKRASAPILANGTLFRRVYYPYKPIRVQVEDGASINAMKTLLGGDGIYDGALITDLSIRSFQEARARAKAEIAPYKNPVITGTWNSDQDGWRAGQIVSIQDTNRGIDSSFVIQKVTRTQKTSGRWSYQVQAGSTMFGLIEFFQLLLRRSDTMLIDVSEIVDVVKTIDEVVSIGEVYRVLKRSAPWYAHTYTQPFSINTIGTEGGSPQDAYADYCEAA